MSNARITLAAMLLLTSLSACSTSQARKDVEAYFSSVCEKEGFTKGTAESAGCVRVKMVQSAPARQGGSGYVFIPPKSGTICRQIGNTNQCN